MIADVESNKEIGPIVAELFVKDIAQQLGCFISVLFHTT